LAQLLEAFSIALRLLFSGDPVVFGIALRTLAISLSSTLLASLVSVPAASLLHFADFRGRRLLASMIHALYSLPTVFVGMLVYLFLSRAGPLGSLELLFTPGAIVIGEAILITPIITGLTLSALASGSRDTADTARALGAGWLQTTLKVLSESRQAVLTAVLMGFGRAVSEMGIAIIVGGNITGYTRTLSTAIALGVGMGETAESIALGLILLLFALVVSISVLFLRSGSRK
jgi:tungstate transport system permease protein